MQAERSTISMHAAHAKPLTSNQSLLRVILEALDKQAKSTLAKKAMIME